VEDGALRRPARVDGAGGTYTVQRLTTLFAPLHAALHGAARRVPPPRFKEARATKIEDEDEDDNDLKA